MPWDFCLFTPKCGTIDRYCFFTVCSHYTFATFSPTLLPVPFHFPYSKDGTLTTTRIKKVKGDQEAFIQELRAALHIPIPHNPKDDPIRVRAGGHIEIRGNYVRPVRTWLAGLGF